ncbi:MAG: hypothetical protein Q9192_005662, partial [Flavoplaca navasiana]
PVKQGYGLSETSPTTHTQPSEDWDKTIGSVGRLLPNQLAKYMSPEEKELPIGEVGELWIKGPNIFKGYLNNPEGTKNALTEDGFFKTGDVGYQDKDGNFYITDRIKELIKYKGFQVAPAELEGLLASHPMIDDVAVLGIYNNDRATEEPRAYVVPAAGVEASKKTEDDIVAWLAAKVANHKRLRGGVRFVDAIPKSPSGKILRRVLKVRAQEEDNKGPKAKFISGKRVMVFRSIDENFQITTWHMPNSNDPADEPGLQKPPKRFMHRFSDFLPDLQSREILEDSNSFVVIDRHSDGKLRVIITTLLELGGKLSMDSLVAPSTLAARINFFPPLYTIRIFHTMRGRQHLLIQIIEIVAKALHRVLGNPLFISAGKIKVVESFFEQMGLDRHAFGYRSIDMGLILPFVNAKNDASPNERHQSTFLKSVCFGQYAFAIPNFGEADLQTLNGDEVMRRIFHRNRKLPTNAFTLNTVICVMVKTMKAHQADSKYPLKWTVSIDIGLVPSYRDKSTICLGNLPYASNRTELDFLGSCHSLILSDETAPMHLVSTTSNMISRADYSMAMDGDSLTIVVGARVQEQIKTVAAAPNSCLSKKQRASVKSPVVIDPQSRKPVDPKKSREKSGDFEAKMLKIYKIPSDSGLKSQSAEKRKGREAPGKSKRLRTNAPLHDLTEHEPKSTATTTENNTITGPSPSLAMSKIPESDLADESKVIDNGEATALKDIDPLGYYGLAEKDAANHTNGLPWDPADDFDDETSLTLQDLDPLSYYSTIEDTHNHESKVPASNTSTASENVASTTFKDVDPLSYFSATENNAIGNGKESSLRTIADSVESRVTSDMEVPSINTIHPYITPPTHQQLVSITGTSTPVGEPNSPNSPTYISEKNTPGSNDSIPWTLSNVTTPTTTFSILDHTTASSTPTIVTTHAELKAATLEAMGEMKSENLSEMKAFMNPRSCDSGLRSTASDEEDKVVEMEDTDGAMAELHPSAPSVQIQQTTTYFGSPPPSPPQLASTTKVPVEDFSPHDTGYRERQIVTVVRVQRDNEAHMLK